MANDQVKIEFDTLYNGKGAEQAAQDVKKVGDAAKKSAGPVQQIGEEFKKVKSAAENFKAVLGGLGIVGAIGGVIGLVTSLKKWFDDAAAAARKIKLEKITKDNENAVKGITAEYEALLKTIDAVNVAILRQRELEAARIKNKRDMEDVQDSMDQQKELDKLDRKDPLYKEKVGEVQAKYKSIAVMRQSGRESEDIQTKMRLEGDKIKELRNTELANRSTAEAKLAEVAKQQQQISELESPVIKTRGVYKSAGAFGTVKVGEEQYEDEAATKQNREQAAKMREGLPALEKEARQYIAIADEAGNKAVHAANMASTLSTARSVSLAKADNETAGATSGREAAYFATDTAQEALNKQRDEQRKKEEADRYNQLAIPEIETRKADLQAAEKRAAEARIDEKNALEDRDSRVRDFEASGSRNTRMFQKSIDPYEVRVGQTKDNRQAAERQVQQLSAALEQILSVYGDGFKEMTSKINRAIVQQKLDASGGE